MSRRSRTPHVAYGPQRLNHKSQYHHLLGLLNARRIVCKYVKLCDVAHLTIHEEGNMRTEYSMRQELSGENTMRTVGPVAQRITRLTTDQKIPGSNPGRVEFFFFIRFYMKLYNACNHERENPSFGFCQC